MNFSKSELAIIEDSEFLITKAKVITKVRELLVKTRSELNDRIEKSTFSFPSETNLSTGKISKGENYKTLPYLVLDHPSLFSATDTFAFRTMFWWGNFFSCTLHLQGHSLDKYRSSVANNIGKLVGENVYIAVGDTPWHYHYEISNYAPITREHIGFIENGNFLKLSKKTGLKHWENIPRFSSEFLELSLSVLH